jgi:hypothetical protein
MERLRNLTRYSKSSGHSRVLRITVALSLEDTRII